MSYIGNQPTSVSFPTDTFSGTGSQTAFTLQLAPASTNSVIVAVSGVVQDPSTYSVSGTTLTFSAAPPAGASNISVRFLGVPGIPNTPTAGSVNNSSFANTLTAIPFASGQSVGAGNSSLMKNRIINGAMVIDQRNAGAGVNATDGLYTVDRWLTAVSVNNKFTVQQNAGSVTPPVGFANYLGCTSSATTSVGSTDYYFLQQSIEGYNVADLGWGTANAKTVTLSFQVYSSLTGTFGGVLKNSASNRSYPFTYTISSANTWTSISITVVGDTSGTWLTTNGIGIRVIFGLGVGSTYSGTAGAWAGANYFSATGATSVVGTSGATFYITGVQLEVGSSATGYEYRQYGTELNLCQRYCFVQSYATGSSNYCSLGIGLNNGTTASALNYYFPVNMRIMPSLTWSGSFSDLNSSGTGTVMTINTSRSGTTQALINVTYSAGSATVGTVCFLNVLNSTTWSAIFSSEL